MRSHGNGSPRVRTHVPIVGAGPYDTSDNVRQVLANLQQAPPGGPPPELAPTDTAPGLLSIPERLIARISGFLDRLEADHFAGRGAMIPPHVKDPTGAPFGVPTKENTVPWGSTVDMSFSLNVPGQPEPVFPIQSQQLLHMDRPRPTTHTTLVVIALGPGWAGENQTTFTVTYIVGVGQGQIAIPKTFTLTLAQLVTPPAIAVLDTNQWPIQSLQIGASYTLSPSNNGGHAVTAAAFVAPFVQ